MENPFKKFTIGPATLVSAAFIGPGTVVTCSIAGASFSYAILWALVFGIVATIVLQEMAGRLTLVRDLSLSETINQDIKHPLVRFIVFFVVISAIGIGNAAYQSGNMTGTMIGVQLFLEENGLVLHSNTIIGIVGILLFVLLFFGKYKVLEKILVVMVIVMSLTFLLTIGVISVAWPEVFRGIFVPSIPKDSLYLVLGLVGTTVVPYNLFLHSSAVKARNWKLKDLRAARIDIVVSIGLGGIISLCIIITSAVGLYGSGFSPDSLNALATQLTPLLGDNASLLLSLGILSAGVTSSLTAPLAASYTVCGLLNKKADFRGFTFRITWILVLLSGLAVTLLGYKPLVIIQYAQFMNGLTLPFIAVLLFVLMNSSRMKEYRNHSIQNVISGIVILVVIFLGIRSLISIF